MHAWFHIYLCIESATTRRERTEVLAMQPYLFLCWLALATVLNYATTSSAEPMFKYTVKLNGSNPAYQDCVDHGEVFAASYLVSKEFLLKHKLDVPLTSPKMSVEWATRMMMKLRIAFQSVDVLDFAVMHLSAYERLSKRTQHITAGKNWHIDSKRNRDIMPVIEQLPDKLHGVATQEIKNKRPNSNVYMKRTVVVMPFLGSLVGMGGSALSSRRGYLQATFWSFYAYYTDIIAFVTTDADFKYLKTEAHLPFKDVILLDDLPGPNTLPVAAVQRSKTLLRNGAWDYDYFFYTESDQVLLMRNSAQIYELINNDPGMHYVGPHRLVPYPKQVTAMHGYHATVPSQPDTWASYQCCMKRQNCANRDDYILLTNDTKHEINFIDVHGIDVILGNVNFMLESYRHCSLTKLNPAAPYCP